MGVRWLPVLGHAMIHVPVLMLRSSPFYNKDGPLLLFFEGGGGMNGHDVFFQKIFLSYFSDTFSLFFEMQCINYHAPFLYFNQEIVSLIFCLSQTILSFLPRDFLFFI